FRALRRIAICDPPASKAAKSWQSDDPVSRKSASPRLAPVLPVRQHGCALHTMTNPSTVADMFVVHLGRRSGFKLQDRECCCRIAIRRTAPRSALAGGIGC